MASLDQVSSELKLLESAIICCHVSPDADAVGSGCALQLGLQSLGVDAVFYVPHAVPEPLQELAQGARIVHELPTKACSAVIAVDTGAKDRVATASQDLFKFGQRVFNIDHHFSNELWGDVNYVDGESPASAVLVYDVLRCLGVEISRQIANLLFAGLLDDTGCFRFSNATAESLECGASLVRAGASPSAVANALYFTVPERMLRLRAKALANLRVELDGKVALIRLSLGELNECAAKPEDAEGLVDLARSVSGTVGAVLVRELESGLWKLSLRSKSPVLDVHKIAASFSGGGHKAAAGCKLRGSAQEVEQQILDSMAEALGAL
jgi:bifunctional oligoribonuclease and PAP phosphatase NrnA